VGIRRAEPRDREFILGLASRLTEFGPVTGRETSQMVARDRAVLDAALTDPSTASAVFVAEGDDGILLGFIHLTTADDYYTASMTGHIADVVVASAAAGRGIGRSLMMYAEQWTRDRGLSMLTLNVFLGNHRARRLYARLGFEEEWIRCIKRLE
jgi:ribosomal protein S18 acetylase RimI-like enzyme